MSDTRNSQIGDMWFRILFEDNPLPILIYDANDFVILEVNGSAERHYGYSRDELLKMSVGDLCLKRNKAAMCASLTSIAANDAHQTGVWRQARKDGTPLYMDVLQYFVPFRGTEAGMLMFHDVTARLEMERIFNEAEQIAKLGCWAWDFTTRKFRWSDQTYRNFGLEPQSAPAGYETFQKVIFPDDVKTVGDLIRQAIATSQPFESEHRVVWPDRSVHVMHTEGQVLFDDESQPLRLVGTVRDVTEERSMEARLREIQRDLQNAEALAHVGSWRWDPATDAYHFSSDKTCRIFGFEPGSRPLGTAVVFQAIHPDDRERVLDIRSKAIAEPDGSFDLEFRVIHRDGGIRTVRGLGEAVVDNVSKARRLIGVVQDITEQKRAAAKIHHLAFYDELTGLPNRTLVQQQLDSTLEACRNAKRPVALLLVELTRFQDINYTLGHAYGDRLLMEVGNRISNVMAGAQMVARVGDDQFAVVLSNKKSRGAASAVRMLLQAMEAPFPVADIAYEFGAHVGVAVAPEHGADSETLFRKADVALHNAKQSGQGYVIYQALHDAYRPQRLALIGEFRKALNEGQLQLYCQPKANMQTGKVSGAEALVRWHHPRFGITGPNQFIPLIEPTDLIHPLTKFMLREAAGQCYRWDQQGIAVRLAVNISPRNLLETGFSANVMSLLHDWNAKSSWLGLEITESSLMNEPATSIVELQRLSEMGFRLFIDDFGTGYSSLSYLTKLPVDAIKIDHSFTMRMLEDERAAAIVKATIDLAHNLGLGVVAEGTASRDIWNALAELGCDEAQGHFISRPLPAREFTDWLLRGGPPEITRRT